MAFSAWLLSLSIIAPGSIRAVACDSTLFLSPDNIPLYRIHLMYPFVNWWTFGWLAPVGYYERCCCERSGRSSRVDMFSFLLGIYLKALLHGNCGSHGHSTLNSSRNCQTAFQSGCPSRLRTSNV